MTTQRITKEQVVALLSVAKLYIGNDSGISHISGAMQLPTIAIFGPTNPNTYQPVGSLSKAISLSAKSFNAYDEKTVETVTQAALDTIKNISAPLFDICL